MCGLTGFLWNAAGDAGRDADAVVRHMANALAHRGPDSAGTWTDPEAGVALGHRRLAVVDLSPSGHQPMASPSGRFVVAFNGEIYDHASIREELDAGKSAPAWRGTSDTETLAAAFDAWGVETALRRATGMFGIAIWDRRAQCLSLARDRLGEKPLYYGRLGGSSFGFASELRALRRHPAFDDEIAREELLHFVRHGYVRAGRSIYRDIRQVRPGELVEIGAGSAEPTVRLYWDSAAMAAERRRRAPFGGSEAEAVDRLDALLGAAVERQMIADVPLGAFLSGGLDSSTVVALMQSRASRPVHTFSIGFHEPRYDEARHARAIAAHLGTDHTDLYVSEGDLLDVVPRLPEIYDEPFGDPSAIPTFLVSQLARRSVTVALSGDGGDELFGGYDRYRQGGRLYGTTRRVPLALRRAISAASEAAPAALLEAALSPVRRARRGKAPNAQWSRRIADYAASAGCDELHRKLVSQTREAGRLVLGGIDAPSALSGEAPPRGDLEPAERMMQLDMLTYLPGDILTKVDRAAMAVSLETRAPLLDHRVAEFAWSLPGGMKAGPPSKRVLRDLLYRYVPPALVERPKMGFEAPISLWLRGPLHDWAGDLLSPARVAEGGLFDPGAVTDLWRQHRSGRFDHGLALWHVLAAEAWRARWH